MRRTRRWPRGAKDADTGDPRSRGAQERPAVLFRNGVSARILTTVKGPVSRPSDSAVSAGPSLFLTALCYADGDGQGPPSS